MKSFRNAVIHSGGTIEFELVVVMAGELLIP